MTPTPTPLPTATATPYFWPTPTPWDTPDAEFALTVPATNPIFVKGAEETVQIYNVANQYGMMDNVITLILIVMIIGAGMRFYWKMRKMGGGTADD